MYNGDCLHEPHWLDLANQYPPHPTLLIIPVCCLFVRQAGPPKLTVPHSPALTKPKPRAAGETHSHTCKGLSIHPTSHITLCLFILTWRDLEFTSIFRLLIPSLTAHTHPPSPPWTCTCLPSCLFKGPDVPPPPPPARRQPPPPSAHHARPAPQPKLVSPSSCLATKPCHPRCLAILLPCHQTLDPPSNSVSFSTTHAFLLFLLPTHLSLLSSSSRPSLTRLPSRRTRVPPCDPVLPPSRTRTYVRGLKYELK